jgi:hypothetical protein
MLLWVDAVGGFLVCDSERILVGQAVPASGVDVAIQGDISRRHLTIHRDGEGYVVAATSRTLVDGREVSGAVALRDGAIIRIGSAVQMRFRQPHPLSASALLTITSHHRTQPAVDGVILMAGTVVLGPAPSCHLQCRDFSQDVILFHREKQWFCRCEGGLEIDGVPYSLEGPVAAGARVAGKDFSLSLESA